jgi:predicted glycoside hydrolase/deacetylase ChbG (UPF0249 family)
MIPANLIINADDFGLDARVSMAIALCLDEGLINSFSVYPFADPFHEGLLRSVLRRHPGAKVGAHLAVAAPGLREHPGHFRDFLALYVTGRFPPARVRALWEGQIADLRRRLGRAPDHLDSHQHLHLLPGLWGIARRLQREFQVPRLRVPYEGLRPGLAHRFPFGAGLQALARLRAGGRSPAFLGFFTSTCFTVEANRAGLARVLAEPDRSFELMVHPAVAEMPAGAFPGAALAPGQALEAGELRKLVAFFRGGARPPA